MIWNFEKMYSIFTGQYQKLLLDGKWGVEREVQRVTDKGDLALTPHPVAFGDKLRNKEITTDFSESQLELITPPFSTVEEVDHYLHYLHMKVAEGIQNEYLWPLSMPPRLPEDEQIPIAKFDTSEKGRKAYIYRQGLANRYGKKMQMISGIHFNYSFGNNLIEVLHRELDGSSNIKEFTDELYFAFARNFLRYRWLLVYLFGASPSYDDTYGAVLKDQVESIRRCCPECCNQYEQYATSLRVSRYGYTNPEQSKYSEFYNGKEKYIQGIRSLMSKKSKAYAKLDVQLNDRVLQKDSEFYSPIRLKQIIEAEESQIDAIEKRGVKYAEIRILDVNPFETTGISLQQMHFLQVFSLFCLFNDNKLLDSKEMNWINKNHHMIALSGRTPNLILNQLNGGKISLTEWGDYIFDRLQLIAKLLDQANNTKVYSTSVLTEYQKIIDNSLLPSAILQDEMYQKHESFLEFGIRKAKEYKQIMLGGNCNGQRI